MINGITYFKFKSPYNGDVTKNCALTGPEIDNNFFTLEGRDVKSLTVEDNDITLNLINGEQIKAKDAFSNFIVNVTFDSEKGVLKLQYQDGRTEELEGFATTCECEPPAPSCDCRHNAITKVAIDGTLTGDGTTKNPLGVLPLYKTGQYKPVDGIIEMSDTNCDYSHTDAKNPKTGDRYIVSEQVSSYGFLYNFRDVTQIACELKRTNSKWRVPSKEDWDDMLNAVETSECDRDHSRNTPNKYLGKWAGKVLKTKQYWEETPSHECCDFNDDYFDNSCDCDHTNSCKPTYCGEMHHGHHHHPFNSDTSGIDKYGFGVVPAGYADDAGNILFFGERASFWTSTNMHFTNIYEKRFDYDKTTVYQDVIPGQHYLSVRLIKDYDGDNYSEMEEILGQSYPTVLMPSIQRGKSIWTAVNLSVTGKHFKELTPNYGQNLDLTTKYFIDEWDGKKWVRNELKEGDSVVVRKSSEGDDVEYRVINGKLMSVATQIYNDVVSKFEPNIKSFEESIEELNNHNKDTDEKIEGLQSQIDNVADEINDTNKTLSDFGNETKKAFDIINDVLTQSINSINSAIQTEHVERVQEIADINNRIDSFSETTDSKLDDVTEEVKRLNNKIEEIENNQLAQEGHLFDTEESKLILKRQNGENIEVEFTLNMGTF